MVLQKTLLFFVFSLAALTTLSDWALTAEPTRPEPPLPSRVLELEQRGDLAGLEDAASNLEIAGTHPQHLELLLKTIRSWRLADIEIQAGNRDGAIKTIEEAIGNLETRSSRALFSGLAAHHLRLVTQKQQAGGKWSLFWEQARSAGITLLQWILVLGLAGALLFVIASIPRRLAPREAIQIDLIDQSVSAADRPAANRSLSQSMLQRLRGGISEAGSGEALLVLDAEGLSSISLRVEEPAATKLDGLVAEGASVAWGPIKITPVVLLEWARDLFRRRCRRRLHGRLFSDSGQFGLEVELLDSLTNEIWQWRAQGRGEDAKELLVARIAVQVLAVLAPSPVSTESKSLVPLLEATTALAAIDRGGLSLEERNKQFAGAETALRRSLGFDPANGLARLWLADLLRRQGRNEEAIEHLSELLDRLAHAPKKGTWETRLWWSARHLKILCHSKIPQWTDFTAAVTELRGMMTMLREEPIPLPPPEPRNEPKASLNLLEIDRTFQELPTADRLRLRPLLRAACATILAFRLNQLTHRSYDIPTVESRRQARLKETQEQMEAAAAWLEQPSGDVDPQALVLARGLSGLALGRALFDCGRFGEAEKRLRGARMLLAEPAEAETLLAQVYLKAKAKLTTHWYSCAQKSIARAAQATPWNQQVSYLQGLLEQNSGAGTDSRALEFFRAAPLIPAARFKAAECITRIRPAAIREALGELRESIRLDPRPDYRLLLFCFLVRDLLRQEKKDLPEAGEAAFFAKTLIKDGTRREFRRRGEILLKTIQALRSGAPEPAVPAETEEPEEPPERGLSPTPPPMKPGARLTSGGA